QQQPSMRSVLVTGANRGIDLGLTRHLISDPSVAIVIATARNVESATELNNLKSPKLHIVKLEVVNENSIAYAVAKVSKIVGDKGLDVLINNAGISYYTPLHGDLPKSKMMEIFEVNSVSPMLIANKFYPLLKMASSKKGSAQIEMISSCLGSIRNSKSVPKDMHIAAYGMSKVCTSSL
ncbi:hypothetical protein PENTCL1PPCAC_14303, partial [Pristionchus entomophagus]